MKEKQGVKIEKNIQVIGKKKDSSEYFFNGIAFLCSLFGILAIAYGFLLTYGIAVSNKLMCILFLGICLLWMGIFHFHKLIKFTLPAVLILYGILIYRFFSVILNGFYKIANAFIGYMNAYYHTALSAIGTTGTETTDILVCICFLLFIPSGFIIFGTVYYTTPWILILLGSIPTVLAFTVGLVMPVFPSLALVFSIAAVMVLRGAKEKHYFIKKKVEADIDYRVLYKIQNQTGILSIVIVLIASVSIAAAPLFASKFQQMESVREWVQNSTIEEAWRDLNEDVSDWGLTALPGKKTISGGMSKGRLGLADEIKYKHEPHLRITSSEAVAGKLYLRGFVGTAYEENRWEKLPDDAAMAGLDGKVIQSQEYDALNTMNRPGDGIASEIQSTQIQVENIGATRDFAYVPYYSNVNTEEYEISSWDSMIDSKKKKSQTYQTIGWEALNSSMWNNMQNELTRFSSGFYMQKQSYQEFAYANYLQVPDNLNTKIQSITNGHSKENLPDAVAFTIDWLRENMEYTLQPGSTSDGKDFVDCFLFEQKKGYCMHFASTAVLMFRSMGIPARYAEGYIALNLHAGQASEILDSNAHAWPEIWIDQFGWIPVEVTPGFYGNEIPEMSAAPDSSQESMDSSQPEETAESVQESRKEEQQESNPAEQTYPSPDEPAGAQDKGQTGQETGEGTAGWLAGIFLSALKILAVLLAAGAAIVLRRRYVIKNRKDRFHQKPSAAIGAVLGEIRKLSLFMKLPFDENTDVDRIKQNYPYLPEQDLKWLFDAAKKARFSNHSMEEEERKRAVSLYDKFAGAAESELKLGRRILFRYWNCFL